ncbi:MAG: hypothetical protein PHW72_00125 [Candidatus Pacebacteria bacterium]|nr:hypothetical protein [Candidatus Paceibacterota bacterium]
MAKTNLFKKTNLLIAGAIALVVFAGIYYYQRNIYSKDILKLEILGPEESDLLGEVEYIVKYKNNGDARLEEPELIFEFPQYALSFDSSNSQRVIKSSDELGGAIYPGEERVLSFKARLLGRENEAKTAKASLSFRPKNLKARYESETTKTTLIKKVPLNFEFDLPSKIDSGKELKFKLNYFSNTSYPISNLRVMVEYPSGFEFLKSSPQGIGEREWDVGLLNKAEGGRIEITGTVSGDVGEEKVFSAKIGSWQNGEFILLKETVRGINIIKPTLYISQQINNSPSYLASPGDNLHYEIFFRNIGEETLTDLSLQVTLEGRSFDLQTLRVMDAEYQSGDNSILWDWKKVNDLQFLQPQEEGRVEFWVKLKDEWLIEDIKDKNPTIADKIYIGQVKEEFVNRVNSKLTLVQKGVYEDEVFGNSGPVPPMVGENTTYTIMWQLKNYYNEVKNVQVKAVLPQNVRLTGKIFPEEEAGRFTFDSKSREIVWNAGDLLVSQGISTPAPNISFQISLFPTSDQKNQTVPLIGKAEISGQDQWTGQVVRSSANSIDTSLPDDLNNNPGGGIVW